MNGDTSGTFGGWSDRLTYLLAEGQLLVAGAAVSIGAALIWIRPEIPGMPPVARGIFAAMLLLGPPLLGLFVTGARKLRNRHMEEVYHINGVTDTRRKLYVAPEVWAEKTVEGPSPYRCNDETAYEVREFTYHEDTSQLVVRGCYFSQMADSKLVTTKTMLEDIHGDLVDAFLEYNRLRGRISKMGLQIQSDVINEEAEADERGLMNPRTSVKERFESAKNDAEDRDIDQIKDVTQYVEEYADEHEIDTTSGPPQTRAQAAEQATATDGGTNQ
ncbi:hypothetical protein C483_14987 [Natrialba hulunbeirensis JCM 10989]|uniref:Uncharacterized protein n=1 Tax=Natrialba hulunbeirensis JCM 10989 TaxID=1227493 RepID=L9ZQN7_9EURY|nr:hypothetical protein [Natrialba hulunbeirensis]ELY88654.1 hypothetical protein C483_14987 [Natrialba hulunbeirensis JCM 10989]